VAANRIRVYGVRIMFRRATCVIAQYSTPQLGPSLAIVFRCERIWDCGSTRNRSLPIFV
jgi:hypothetical protein